ncbi:MAG: polyphenol oxidase family protein, partial [Lachnospiraceae bacterium]|nr:polyphenol oxidase family protein [Lachnospiraceae bacterium]
RKVGRGDCGSGFLRPLAWRDVDGFITDEPGCVLSTFYADCVPLFFADPVHRAIGLSHSGWRGTANGIGMVTVDAMTREFGTNPADLICGIGPSICRDCYEVGEDVARYFTASCLCASETDSDKYYLDLWEANKAILLGAGVREENITLPNLCTACNSDLLFSHRASKGRRGNLGAFLAIV